MQARELSILIALAGGCLAGTAIAIFLDRLYSSSRDGARPAIGGGGVRRRRLMLLVPATAMLWGACAFRAFDARHFVLMALFGSALLALSATDFERHLLPNRLMYPAIVAALLVSAAWPQRQSVAILSGETLGATWPGWASSGVGATLSALAGGLSGTTIMLALFLILPGFGFGDVKLGGLIGLILGFPAVLTGLLIGMLLGGAGAAAMLLSGRVRLRSAIAYGPYLAYGAILEMLLRR